MSLFRVSMLVITALGLASSGCLGELESDDMDDAPGAPAHPLDGPEGGHGTGNGLMPSDFHPHKLQLLDALSHVVSPGAHAVRSDIALNLLDTEEGRKVFDYATSCSLGSRDYLEHDHVDYIGDGVIRDGDDWLTGAPSSQVQSSVLTCVAARLNGEGEEVPILLLGPEVQDDGVTLIADYPFVEMVVSAYVNPLVDGHVTINVWPQEDLLRLCGYNLEGSLGSRFCDNTPGACGMVLRDDFKTACTGEPGNWECDGAPAIETRLHTVDIARMHRDCVEP